MGVAGSFGFRLQAKFGKSKIHTHTHGSLFFQWIPKWILRSQSYQTQTQPTRLGRVDFLNDPSPHTQNWGQ